MLYAVGVATTTAQEVIVVCRRARLGFPAAAARMRRRPVGRCHERESEVECARERESGRDFNQSPAEFLVNQVFGLYSQILTNHKLNNNSKSEIL